MFDWLTPQLAWFAGGVLFILLEFIIPGVLLVFFGIGAILTALLAWLEVLPSLTEQLIFFCVSSLALLFGLRKYLSRFFKGEVSDDGMFLDSGEYKGKTARVTRKIAPESPDGRIQFEGTEWKAVSGSIIEEGTLIEITGKKNITFTVKPVTEKGAE